MDKFSLSSVRPEQKSPSSRIASMKAGGGSSGSTPKRKSLSQKLSLSERLGARGPLASVCDILKRVVQEGGFQRSTKQELLELRELVGSVAQAIVDTQQDEKQDWFDQVLSNEVDFVELFNVLAGEPYIDLESGDKKLRRDATTQVFGVLVSLFGSRTDITSFSVLSQVLQCDKGEASKFFTSTTSPIEAATAVVVFVALCEKYKTRWDLSDDEEEDEEEEAEVNLQHHTRRLLKVRAVSQSGGGGASTPSKDKKKQHLRQNSEDDERVERAIAEGVRRALQQLQVKESSKQGRTSKTGKKEKDVDSDTETESSSSSDSGSSGRSSSSSSSGSSDSSSSDESSSSSSTEGKKKGGSPSGTGKKDESITDFRESRSKQERERLKELILKPAKGSSPKYLEAFPEHKSFAASWFESSPESAVNRVGNLVFKKGGIKGILPDGTLYRVINQLDKKRGRRIKVQILTAKGSDWLDTSVETSEISRLHHVFIRCPTDIVKYLRVVCSAANVSKLFNHKGYEASTKFSEFEKKVTDSSLSWGVDLDSADADENDLWVTRTAMMSIMIYSTVWEATFKKDAKLLLPIWARLTDTWRGCFGTFSRVVAGSPRSVLSMPLKKCVKVLGYRCSAYKCNEHSIDPYCISCIKEPELAILLGAVEVRPSGKLSIAEKASRDAALEVWIADKSSQGGSAHAALPKDQKVAKFIFRLRAKPSPSRLGRSITPSWRGRLRRPFGSSCHIAKASCGQCRLTITPESRRW